MWLALPRLEDEVAITTDNMSLSSPADSLFKRMAEAIYNPTDVMVMMCTFLALYNSCELIALIFVSFRRWSGLYFWSLCATTFAILPYGIGWLLDYFDIVTSHLGMAMQTIGWVFLVTGQSVVLFSRLHLVLYDERILRGVLWMVIINGCVWHTTMTVLLYTKTHGESRKGNHSPQLYNNLEKVQLTFFCAQEFTISGLYIWKVLDILRTSVDQKRRFMWYLFGANVIIVAMDIALLAIMYKNHFLLEQGIKMVIYSVKLKLEFATLSKLVEFVRTRGASNQSEIPPHQRTSEFMDLSSNRSKAGKVPRSSSVPDCACIEHQASGSGTSSWHTHEQGMGKRAGRESGSDAEDVGSNQLYNTAVRQMSRP